MSDHNQSNGLTEAQKTFLQGFAMGTDVARAVRGLPILSGSAAAPGAVVTLGPKGTAVGPPSPERLQVEAQDRAVSGGKVLCKEEAAKRAKDPLTMYDEIQANARAGLFPKDTNVFLYKYSGLFFVAPAQNAFMCRLRLPGGVIKAWQFRGVAGIARELGGGYADVTTRANLQVREIGPHDAPAVLTTLTELGIVARGSGADNIRNVTCNPTSGIDPQELIETLPLAKEMHHYILNHREMYGLPRKFNIAFDGGGRISSLDDTNDIGFKAVNVREDSAADEVSPGVYFRLTLGGITGHKDFARDTGVLLRPEECVPVAAAIVRVFIRSGDRTDRKKARLKYVLDDWGFDKFLAEVETELGKPLRKVSSDRWELSGGDDRWGHVGVHPQKQHGRFYVGVVLPVGRMTADQMDGLADIAERFGRGTIRLTVWQNLLISDVKEGDLPAVKNAIEALGLGWDASSVRSGLVACTGNAGCKFAASDTKGHAMILARYLESRVNLDQPINIHLTGCHHSCAQHYIGDLGLEATKVEVGDDLVEGYHLCVGGGYGTEQGIGRRLFDAMPFDAIPPAVERLLKAYQAHRLPNESFSSFARRQTLEALRAAGEPPAVTLNGSVASELSLQTA
ncbi:NirA family protein [Singulisphaera acidiphila]|uniref:Precorrin-3B synthase n=1 Tax=Singulisphaera acidiphila (strain ATCC BAA-1392 / DSM 18658 / VKM B-2454 / MOB10) TaxID=886293 RepID=L0DMK0_SINAD|nr:NirA family protein [Singulisphaera acidiphila]AGA29881.1 precorrin-3B synthase [Singulisphaera acidiphila DSM 18658]